MMAYAAVETRRGKHAPCGWLLTLALGACQSPPAEPSPEAHSVAPTAALEDEVPRVHLQARGQLGPGGGTLLIDLGAPRGAKLTLDAPRSARASGGIGLGFPQALSGALGSHELPLRMPIEVADGATGPVKVELSYFWCTEGNEAACRRERAELEIALDLSGDAAGGEAHVGYLPRGDKT